MQILEPLHLVGSGQFAISNEYDCHVYLVDCGAEVCLIDAGAGLGEDRVLANIASAGYSPERITRIFVTHAHADHAGGCRGLVRATGAEVVTSAAEGRLMAEGDDDALGLVLAKHSACYPPDYVYPHCKPDRIVADGDQLQLGEVLVTCYVVPGHSAGSVCYLFESLDGRSVLFTGDTVFFRGLVGLLNCPGSDIALYRESIARLAEVQFDSLMPGHLLFALERGMEHIAQAHESLKGVFLPRSMGQL
jgi:glyoxylase-like metal-dependent hydrolase (beta-lactamase superfamily II)